jgi:hypothetical protein
MTIKKEFEKPMVLQPKVRSNPLFDREESSSSSNRNKKALGATKHLILIIFVILIVATSQLLQGHYHVQKYLHFSSSTGDKEAYYTNHNSVKSRLRRFRAGKKVMLNNRETHNQTELDVSTAAKKAEKNEEQVQGKKDSEAAAEQNHIVTILKNAGIAMTPQLLDQIPPFSDVEQMYGSKPIILGLDRCEEFRQNVDPPLRVVGAAGYVNYSKQSYAFLLCL